MLYQVIARKYRPQSFDEVIGQSHVTQTLSNAIESKRIGQAYLFSGPRGVGKTTIARILVKCLNCEQGLTVKPCEKCKSCREIKEGSSLDYEEIDGASNRGIDQIREINESLHYSSAKGNYRVFVIDEVHMLTIEAFNALLKSLEEPPLKVIFILCTTEKHKIPNTIKSRCQHFHFKAMSNELIMKVLRKIIKKEKLICEESVFYYIAKNSGGSIRDCENLLEQIVSYCGDKITLEKTIEMLGETPQEIKLDFIKNLYKEDFVNNHKILSYLQERGQDVISFFYDLIRSFSNLLYLKEGIDNEFIESSKSEISFLNENKENFKLREIFKILDILFDFIKELKGSSQEKTVAEFCLIKLHRYKHLISPEELKANLINLSKYTLADNTILSTKSKEKEVKEVKSNEIVKEKKVIEEKEKLSFVKSSSILSSSKVERLKPLSKEIYEEFVRNIRDKEFRLLVEDFIFENIKGNVIFLQNNSNIKEKEIEGFKEKFKENYKLFARKELVEGISKIEIKKNMIQSNIEKMKRVFLKTIKIS